MALSCCCYTTANAVIVTISADYLFKSLWSLEPISPWTLRIVAFGCVTTFIFINYLGATARAQATNVLCCSSLAPSALGSILILDFVAYYSTTATEYPPQVLVGSTGIGRCSSNSAHGNSLAVLVPLHSGPR
ncbi:hypothetical protein F4779DRAFT_245273 [Xylariaceae sp. FL0662B]|nr:hypothetical protein F4779DRAFT_245273 [Xylariaceae sp. FL0662B]